MTVTIDSPGSSVWHLDYEADCRHADGRIEPDVWYAGTSQILRTGPSRVFWGAIPAADGKHIDAGATV